MAFSLGFPEENFYQPGTFGTSQPELLDDRLYDGIPVRDQGLGRAVGDPLGPELKEKFHVAYVKLVAQAERLKLGKNFLSNLS